MIIERPACKDITLTNAMIDDFEFYYSLKCEKNSICWGGFKAKPSHGELQAWFGDILSLSGVAAKRILIIRCKGISVGVISFKIIEGSAGDDYSINVSEKFSGLGIATCAVKKSEKYISDNFTDCKLIRALVRLDNTASQKIFRKSGWLLTNDYESRFLESDQKAVDFQIWVKELLSR